MLKFCFTTINLTIKILTNMYSESYSLKITGAVFILLLLKCSINAEAQPGLTTYADAGKNSVSGGLYIRSAILANYKSGNYQLKAGFQTNLVNRNQVIFSGYRVDGSREFRIKNTLLEINGFWLRTAYSDILQETNYGCAFSVKTNHFDMQTGTNFRTYSFRKRNLKEYEIRNAKTKIHENFNLMYSFSYNLKPSDYRWNAGLTITNIDNFLINQETNPYVNLNGYFRVSSPVCLFAEVWYKNAGVTNISSNYFGFLIRGGVQWNFN